MAAWLGTRAHGRISPSAAPLSRRWVRAFASTSSDSPSRNWRVRAPWTVRTAVGGSYSISCPASRWRILVLRLMPSNTDHFAVIGVGASAGGLAALTSLVSALPSKANFALIAVQHLDRRVESQLA